MTVLLAIWMGPLALPVLAVGLVASGVAAWARITPEDAIPRVVVLLVVALIIEAAILIHYSN